MNISFIFLLSMKPDFVLRTQLFTPSSQWWLFSFPCSSYLWTGQWCGYLSSLFVSYNGLTQTIFSSSSLMPLLSPPLNVPPTSPVYSHLPTLGHFLFSTTIYILLTVTLADATPVLILGDFHITSMTFLIVCLSVL